jgi:hypothetical protein
MTVACVLAALALASTASANQATTIIEKCLHGEPFGGYSQSAYRQALKAMPTEAIEYSPCENLIRKAEEAAAGGGGSGGAAGAAAPNTPLPLSPAEQRAVKSAHSGGSTAVQIGGEPIHPGVVHANIASAVNTLPRSLLAVLAFLLAGALALVAGEVYKRVRASRDG